MPVTISPASIDARRLWHRRNLSSSDLLESCCPSEHSKCKEPITSSFSSAEGMRGASNGLVDTVTLAYNDHHHLSIRPEDVWFSILVQFSHYVNAHADEMRSNFVSHEGKEHIIVYDEGEDFLEQGDIFATLAMRMAKEMERRITETDMREWIMPSFTTTTKTDETIAAVIMMGTLQSYFTYEFYTRCGLPSVTLLGKRSDWVNMLERLEKIPSFGKEPSQWYKLLKPVLTRFVQSFDQPESEPTKEFWKKIIHVFENGSGPTYYTGWITAFMFWDIDGKPLYVPEGRYPTSSVRTWDGGPEISEWDGIQYHRVNTGKVPPAFVSLPVIWNNGGIKRQTLMVAGSVGTRVISSRTSGQSTPFDSVSPGVGWWLFEKKSDEEMAAEKAEKDESERLRKLD